MLGYHCLQFLILLFSGVLCLTYGLFSSMTETRYEVQLKTEPASISLDDNLFSFVDVYSKHGQKFRCQVPNNSPVVTPEPPPSVNNSFIDSALSRLNSSRCLIKTVNWWTYELCYRQHISQFYLENGERRSETLIGRFESETNWSTVENMASEHPLIHNQSYVNGSICNLTFKRREAQVHYKCIPGDNNFHISSVEELETCVYRLEVSAPSLCVHPSFTVEKQKLAEPIFCNPIVPANFQDEAEASTAAELFPKASEKRVVNFAYVILKRHEDHQRRRHRLIRRKMRQFIHHLIDPPTKTPLALMDLQRDRLIYDVFPWLYSTPVPVLMEQIDSYVFAAELNKIKLPDSMLYKSYLNSEPESVPLRELMAVRSLLSFLIALAENKILHIIHPNLQPVHFNADSIKQAVETFNAICQELVNLDDPEFSDAVVDDLELLLQEYGQSSTEDVHVLTGTSIDGNSDVHLVLQSPNIQPWKWPLTPSSVNTLRLSLKLAKLSFNKLDQDIQAVERSLKFDDAESSFEHQLKGLLNDMASKVLVVRSMAERIGEQAGKRHDETSDEDDHEYSTSKHESHPRSPKTDVMQQLTSMIEKVLRRVPSDQVQDLEIYEAGSGNGAKTFYIISSEERGKEQRRMKALENAYNFVGTATDSSHKQSQKNVKKSGTL